VACLSAEARRCLCCTLQTLGATQEGNLWRKLQSRDVVKLMGVGAENLDTITDIKKSFFIVCEYMEGGTLRSAIQRQMFSSKKDVYHTHDILRYVHEPVLPEVCNACA
jgi:hypothetical protein